MEYTVQFEITVDLKVDAQDADDAEIIGRLVAQELVDVANTHTKIVLADVDMQRIANTAEFNLQGCNLVDGFVTGEN